MELTEKEALGKTIEMWEGLAETGGNKEDWMDENGYTGEYIHSNCFLCEYSRDDCVSCPIMKVIGEKGCYSTSYGNWEHCDDYEYELARQYWAGKFVNELKEIRDKLYLPEPTEVWEDVTEECYVTLERYSSVSGAIPLLKYDGFIVAHLVDVGEGIWVCRPDIYKVKQHGYRIKAFKRV